MPISFSHQAVLLREALDALNVRPQGVYIDATFGRGGHAAAILNVLGSQGRLLALDKDPEAERFACAHFKDEPRFIFERSSFSRLAEIAAKHRITGRVQGILLDIGVSSPQLDDPQRGFSFSREGPLDMRMDPTIGIDAAEWLATVSESVLSKVLREFGEERFHRRIARALVKARQMAPIKTTQQLAQIIAASVPFRERNKHPATRSFQAIRIVINRELTELESVLTQGLEILAPGGRLVVISFHSLEDRIVKRFMRQQARGLEWPLHLPVTAFQSGVRLRVIGRPLRPAEAETGINPRARSAIMRVAERLA